MARKSEPSGILDTIYAAAIEPSKWSDALGALRRLCKAASASYTVQHIAKGTGLRTAIGYDLPHQPRYFDGFAARNELFTGLLRQAPGKPHPHQTLVDDEIFRQGFYFNEYCRPNGLHSMAGLVISRRGDTVEWISVNRCPRGEPYDRQQLRMLAWLAPHLHNASEISYRLTEAHAARAAWESALDALRYGVLTLDQHGRVVFANSAARRLDMAHDGLALRCAAVSAPGAAGATLARAIGLATDGDSDGVRHGAHVALRRRGALCPLSVTIIPLPHESSLRFSGTPVVLMLIVDPTQPAGADTRALVNLFGLTDREAELVALLADGYRLDAAAAQLGVGRETVRTHLARSLHKTGTERQTDLVRLTLAATQLVASTDAIKRRR
jgi:DNA-binding CsgD family transcriptional regulator/PAS domain-containing protein